MHLPAGIIWCLTVTIAASSALDITDVRLVNGTGLYGGRVEVSINGVWGTICDDSFDINDATIICRMMNLKATTFVKGARFGQGKGPIHTQQLHCSGLERHLRDCSFVANGQCTHARDVGIICSQCSDIVITNRNAADISADGTILSVNCGNGVTTSTCMNGIWSPPSIVCKNDIRLVNGIGLFDGRIELFMNDTWGTLCSTSFSFLESYAICNIMFGTSSSLTYDTSSDDYGQGIGPIHIDKLDCQGSETNINECSYSRNVSCTSHSKDAAVACWITPEITATRLVNGTGPYDGRIELYGDGHWGTVGDRDIDMYGAQSICNTLNKSLAAYFTTPIYGEGSGPVLVGGLGCSSSKKHIKYCTVYSPYRPYYKHDYDLSIACTSCGLPAIYNGEPFSFNNTELTVKCKPGFFQPYIKMRCLSNGSWVEDLPCTSGPRLNITDARLVNGTGPYDGRAEIKVNDTWGTICDKNFNMRDAGFFCRMLGLRGAHVFPAAIYGEGSGPVFIDELLCESSDADLSSCKYLFLNECSHERDVSVLCNECGVTDISHWNSRSFRYSDNSLYADCNYYNTHHVGTLKLTCDNETQAWVTEGECQEYSYPLNVTDVRLAGGPHLSSGRVEIKSLDTWGTVCDDGFGMAEANVICNMIGFPHAVTFYKEAYYGEGKGPTFVDDLNCGQDSLDLNECIYVTKDNCGHSEDISVACTGPRLPITDARLVNGTGPYDGRAEIKVNDTWGTVCDNNFNLLDADFFCKMLGLRGALVFPAAFYGEGSGPVFIDQLFCESSDVDLSSCKYLFLNECSHERDVSVLCNNYPLNVTGIRLAEGPRPSSGRVEIKSSYTWGTVCDDNFGMAEANVICNMIGFPQAVTFYQGAYYGKGKGPVFVDDLNCGQDSLDLNDCTYVTYDDCGHGEDISVACTGPRLPITDARLVNGTGPYDGRAEIKVNDTWGTICDNNFNLLDADFFCKMLGLRGAHVFPAAIYGEGSGPVFIDQLFCESSDVDLSSCKYLFLNECSHERDVSVLCNECGVTDISHWNSRSFRYSDNSLYADCNYYNTHHVGTLKLTCDNETQAWVTEGECQEYSYPLNVTDVRLAGGPHLSSGRVEIKSLDTWGTVCDDNFGMAEANVICNMIGFPHAVTVYHDAYYGGGKGPIFVDDLNCGQDSLDLNECTYVTKDDCGHSEDISVACTGPRLPITDARLVNGTGPYDGRAEIKVNDTWGTVCDNNFNLLDADFFCKMLGLRGAHVFPAAIYGEGSGPVFIDQLFCESSDVDLSSCKYLFLNECSHERDVSVLCNECGKIDDSRFGPRAFTSNGNTVYADCSDRKNYAGTLKFTCNNETQTWVTEGECLEYSYPLNVTDVRLAGGPHLSSGRVEIKSLDTWGTVCDDNFGMAEANVICNMIGFPHAVTFYDKAYYGKGKGPTFVDDLNCGQDSLDLNDCTYVTYDDCGHGEDISVACTDCGDPAPDNGFINSSSTMYGAVVQVTCEKGYHLKGDANIMCLLNGTWSSKPTCNLINASDNVHLHSSTQSVSGVEETTSSLQTKEHTTKMSTEDEATTGHIDNGATLYSNTNDLSQKSPTIKSKSAYLQTTTQSVSRVEETTSSHQTTEHTTLMSTENDAMIDEISIQSHTSPTGKSETAYLQTTTQLVSEVEETTSSHQTKVHTTFISTDNDATTNVIHDEKTSLQPNTNASDNVHLHSSTQSVSGVEETTSSLHTKEHTTKISTEDEATTGDIDNGATIYSNTNDLAQSSPTGKSETEYLQTTTQLVSEVEETTISRPTTEHTTFISTDNDATTNDIYDKKTPIQPNTSPTGKSETEYLQTTTQLVSEVEETTSSRQTTEHTTFISTDNAATTDDILYEKTPIQPNTNSDVDGNNYKIIIIISACIVVLTAAIIGLVAVIIRLKRKSKRVQRNNDLLLNEEANRYESLELNSQHDPNGDIIQNEYDAISPYEN